MNPVYLRLRTSVTFGPINIGKLKERKAPYDVTLPGLVMVWLAEGIPSSYIK
jgi:hypothetical protein